MIRKHTQFFDSTLNLIEPEKAHCYENARTLCEKIAELIVDVSFLGVPPEHKDDIPWLRGKLEDLIKGVSIGEEYVLEFAEASKKVYRLESLFRYPWESSNLADETERYRRMALTMKFFEKGTKEPFYKMDFLFYREGQDFHWLDY